MKNINGHTKPFCKSHYILRIKIDATFNIKEYAKSMRRIYIDKCINHKPLNTCPECGGTVFADEDERICTKCGLVVQASQDWVGGLKINLPYGKRLK